MNLIFLQGTRSPEGKRVLRQHCDVSKSLKTAWKCEGIDFPHTRNSMDVFAFTVLHSFFSSFTINFTVSVCSPASTKRLTDEGAFPLSVRRTTPVTTVLWSDRSAASRMEELAREQ